MVLGLILFNIFIKSMEEGINSMIMKPTEDTKLQCAPVEIIKMDTDRFEIKAANKKTRQLRKNENS